MYSGFRGTFFIHLISLCTSISSLLYIFFTCSSSKTVQQLLILSLLFPAVNSALALVRYGMSEGYKLRKLHVVTLNLSMIGSVSFLQWALNLQMKSPMRCFITTALNLIPFLQNIKKIDYRTRRYKTDAIIAMNCFFLLWDAISNENYYAIAYTFSYIFGYFYVGDSGYFFDTEVPSIDIYQYMQCFMCYFAINAFCD